MGPRVGHTVLGGYKTIESYPLAVRSKLRFVFQAIRQATSESDLRFWVESPESLNGGLSSVANGLDDFCSRSVTSQDQRIFKGEASGAGITNPLQFDRHPQRIAVHTPERRIVPPKVPVRQARFAQCRGRCANTDRRCFPQLPRELRGPPVRPRASQRTQDTPTQLRVAMRLPHRRIPR